MGKLHLQMLVTSLVVILYIPMTIYMGKTLGLTGVLIANTIVYFINYTWAKIQCTLILNQKATGIWNK